MIFDVLYGITGLPLFQSRFFAASAAVVLAFIGGMLLFPPYIRLLRRFHFSSELDTAKRQPVMPAGIFFMLLLIPIVLLTSRFNVYVTSALIVYFCYSLIGAVDDIAKIYNKRRLIRKEISLKDYQYKTDGISASLRLGLYLLIATITAIVCYCLIPEINRVVTVPFWGSYEGVELPVYVFIPLMSLVIAILANGVNFTDGFDTLATVPLLTNFVFIALIGYVSSRPDWSRYFIIPQIQGINEIIPFVGAVLGVLLAFLWFNSPPSDIIMGDSGSIGLGGLLGILFVFTKSEFYMPIVAFVFLVEFASSFIQIFYYKMTKKRIFLMAPIHHHFEIHLKRKGVFNRKGDVISKITWRFHILSIFLLVVGLVLYMKVR
ncbi:phospho-N-acetylmuramoyl-pentapeptide-transferase [Chitinivibrio alkaliphilus]|uniref:Phospho-N-acetylmuramoyl-pentapeptide-transferase n=1 Tax=Chitinivibrio alkaliphilus ACht1 TaxID=1313304 RepID=U7DA91_9BACT|nr:phospho-N-acetylmuramoyl-pentapeptide-transferase [Chitinivibrio alkaliphilus]ERP32047.1 Phospho-N-acetylmuramoyl-pentapeptide-transferase [Chitinivibrio alkaliphilus ACht1]